MNPKSNPQGLGADFGAYVPGFDFLQKLAHGDPQALYASWIAPTLDPKVLDQRITELKAVLFWLEQNTAALKATLQALELQKMTLAALRSMGSPMPGVAPASDDRTSASGASATSGATGAQAQPGAAPPFVADAMQYWGALTQQFQTIAAQAMQEVAARTAASAAANADADADSEPQPAAAPAAEGLSPRASDEPARSGAAGPAARAAPAGAQPRRNAKPKPRQLDA